MALSNLRTANGGKSKPESGKKGGGDVLFARYNNLTATLPRISQTNAAGDVLFARFNTVTEAHHAQQMLACFGYPEDAATMIELSHIAPKIGYSQDAPQQTINQILIFGAVFFSTIFITLTSLFMAGTLSPAEIGLMLLVWIILTAAGVVICFYIGETVWRFINSEVPVAGFEALKQWMIWISVNLRIPIEQLLKVSPRPRGKIWLSVKLRAPGDARKIERRWREIAPKRHDLWIIQAKD
jgi:hypothetical protein